MLCDVKLHGNLADKFGSDHQFDVRHVVDIVRAFNGNFKDFIGIFSQGHYHIFINNESISQEETQLMLSKGDVVSIYPAVAGSKQGVVKTIVGAILTVAAIVTQQYWALPMTIGMTLSGISTMLTPVPKSPVADKRDPVDQQASWLFNNPTNRSSDGNVVPVVYGEFITGSVTISTGLYVQQL